MEEALFIQLIESVKQAGEIIRNRQKMRERGLVDSTTSADYTLTVNTVSQGDITWITLPNDNCGEVTVL